jgi:hypothetical protein
MQDLKFTPIQPILSGKGNVFCERPNWIVFYLTLLAFSLPLPVICDSNLLKDGSFELVRQDQLGTNWFLETEDVFDGKQCIRFSTKEAPPSWSSSGYFQKLSLKPDHTYALRLSAKSIDFRSPPRSKAAYLRLRLYDKDGNYIKYQSGGGFLFARAGDRVWSTSIFYFQPPKGAVEGRLEPELWRCNGTVLVDAVSIADLGVALNPRSFTTGGKVFTRLPTPELGEFPEFTADERRQGFVVFRRDEPGFIFPNSFPKRGEIIDTFDIQSARGESCGVGFAVYPLEKMDDVRLEMSGLKRSLGSDISRRGMSLHRVRFWPQAVGGVFERRFAVIPEILEPMMRDERFRTVRFRPLPTEYDLSRMKWMRSEINGFPSRQPQLFWLSLDVPAFAESGTYRGTIRVSGKGIKASTLRVRLNVLPFRLVRPKQFQSFFLYDHRFDCYADKRLAAEFHEMKKFGVESVILGLENIPARGMADGLQIGVEDIQGRKRITSVGAVRLERILKAFTEADMKGPIIIGFNPMLSRRVARELGRPKQEGADMAQWSDTVQEGMLDVLRGTSAIMARFGQADNWAMALKDEATESYKLHIQQEAMLARKAGIMAHLTGGLESGRLVEDTLDIIAFPRIYSGEQIPIRRKWCDKNNIQHWFYEGGDYVNQDGKVFPNRFFSGFQLIKSGARCHVAYTFQDGQVNPWNEFIGRWGTAWNTTYPVIPEIGWDAGAFISTLQWEGIKQGFADACYWATLSEAIRQARQSGVARLRHLAEQAEAARERLLSKVPWSIENHYGYPSGPVTPAAVPSLGFHNGQADVLRKKLAEMILGLHLQINEGN